MKEIDPMIDLRNIDVQITDDGNLIFNNEKTMNIEPIIKFEEIADFIDNTSYSISNYCKSNDLNDIYMIGVNTDSASLLNALAFGIPNITNMGTLFIKDNNIEYCSINNFKNKPVILITSIISSGNTYKMACDFLNKNGAKEIITVNLVCKTKTSKVNNMISINYCGFYVRSGNLFGFGIPCNSTCIHVHDIFNLDYLKSECNKTKKKNNINLNNTKNVRSLVYQYYKQLELNYNKDNSIDDDDEYGDGYGNFENGDSNNGIF